MYTNEMLESMKKVEAARAANASFEPRHPLCGAIWSANSLV